MITIEIVVLHPRNGCSYDCPAGIALPSRWCFCFHSFVFCLSRSKAGALFVRGEHSLRNYCVTVYGSIVMQFSPFFYLDRRKTESVYIYSSTNNMRRGRQVKDGGPKTAYGCAVPAGPTPTIIRACWTVFILYHFLHIARLTETVSRISMTWDFPRKIR